MKKSIIVAVANNSVIGDDNKMPWHLPGDFKYFKATTMKKPIIMGRKTFDSIGHALPGRINIVITRDNSWQGEGTVTATSIPYAYEMAEQMRLVNSVDEIMIIGGANIYEQTISDVDKLYVTEVDMDIKGDSLFPEINKNDWTKTSVSQDFNENNTVYRFVVYERKK